MIKKFLKKKTIKILLIILLLLTFYIYLNIMNEYFSLGGLFDDKKPPVNPKVPKKSDMFDSNKCTNNPEDTGKFDTLGCSMSNSLTETGNFFKEGISSITNTIELGEIIIN